MVKFFEWQNLQEQNFKCFKSMTESEDQYNLCLREEYLRRLDT